MKIILLIVILFIAIGVKSQTIPKEYRKYFVNCCNSNPTTIRSLINIDGYYKLTVTQESNPSDTSYSTILFYENGICVSGWGVYESDKQQFLNSVISKGRKDDFYVNSTWGFYEMREDTIIVRTIVPGTLMRPVSVWERWYKAIDRNTIQEIYFMPLKQISKKAKSYYEKIWADFNELPSKFYPLEKIPPSEYSWLRRQKCIICN